MDVTKHRDGTYSLKVTRDEMRVLSLACSGNWVDYSRDLEALKQGGTPRWALRDTPMSDSDRDWNIKYAAEIADESYRLNRELEALLYPRPNY